MCFIYSNKFEFVSSTQGLIYLDISSITLDTCERIWIAGDFPNGYLQVYDRTLGLIKEISHLEVEKIDNIIINDLNAFAVFEGNVGDFQCSR